MSGPGQSADVRFHACFRSPLVPMSSFQPGSAPVVIVAVLLVAVVLASVTGPVSVTIVLAVMTSSVVMAVMMPPAASCPEQHACHQYCSDQSFHKVLLSVCLLSFCRIRMKNR